MNSYLLPQVVYPYGSFGRFVRRTGSVRRAPTFGPPIRAYFEDAAIRVGVGAEAEVCAHLISGSLLSAGTALFSLYAGATVVPECDALAARVIVSEEEPAHAATILFDLGSLPSPLSPGRYAGQFRVSMVGGEVVTAVGSVTILGALATETTVDFDEKD